MLCGRDQQKCQKKSPCFCGRAIQVKEIGGDPNNEIDREVQNASFLEAPYK